MFFFGWRFSGRLFNKYFTCVNERGRAPPTRDEGAVGARLEMELIHGRAGQARSSQNLRVCLFFSAKVLACGPNVYIH